MCGIAGIYHYSSDNKVNINVIKNMLSVTIHGGPDDEGFYAENNIGLGIKRLSIIGLETGHQPIHNENMDVWVVLNRWIYNFVELKKELEHDIAPTILYLFNLPIPDDVDGKVLSEIFKENIRLKNRIKYIHVEHPEMEKTEKKDIWEEKEIEKKLKGLGYL